MNRKKRYSVGCALLIFFFFSIVFPVFGFLLQVVSTLLLGWISCIKDVLPQIRINGEILFQTLICLVGMAIGTHFFSSWIYNHRTKNAKKWRKKWSGALLITLLLTFIMGIAFVGIIHQIFWLSREKIAIHHYGFPIEFQIKRFFDEAKILEFDIAELQRFIQTRQDDIWDTNLSRHKFVCLLDEKGELKWIIAIARKDIEGNENKPTRVFTLDSLGEVKGYSYKNLSPKEIIALLRKGELPKDI